MPASLLQYAKTSLKDCTLLYHAVSTFTCQHVLQVQLATAVCNARFMTPAVLRLFTEDTPDEVVLPECSALDPPCLSEALVQCASPRCASAINARSSASACLRAV